MACYTLNRLAQSALDTLDRWDEDLARNATAAQAAYYDIEHTRSAARERSQRQNDVVATRVVVRSNVSYSAYIRCVAGNLINQHQRDVDRGRKVQANADAIAAWKLVLRTNHRDELVERVRIAARATFQVPI